MPERDSAWRIAASLLLIVAGCAPAGAPPKPGSSSSGGGNSTQVTQECFIPADSRAMLPEALARDIEAKCEPPAIPRKVSGAATKPMPTASSGFSGEPRVRLATPTPEVPPEADRLSEALDSLKTVRVLYKDFSETEEWILTMEYVQEGDYKMELQQKSINDDKQVETRQSSHMKTGDKFWAKEGDGGWEEGLNQGSTINVIMMDYMWSVIRSVQERKFEKKVDHGKKTETFSVSYPVSKSPMANTSLIPKNTRTEKVNLIVDSITYFPLALRVEDFSSSGKLLREVVATYDFNVPVTITPPVGK